MVVSECMSAAFVTFFSLSRNFFHHLKPQFRLTLRWYGSVFTEDDDHGVHAIATTLKGKGETNGQGRGREREDGGQGEGECAVIGS